MHHCNHPCSNDHCLYLQHPLVFQKRKKSCYTKKDRSDFSDRPYAIYCLTIKFDAIVLSFALLKSIKRYLSALF